MIGGNIVSDVYCASVSRGIRINGTIDIYYEQGANFDRLLVPTYKTLRKSFPS